MFALAELRKEIDEIDKVLARARWVIPSTRVQRASPNDGKVIEGQCRRIEPQRLPMTL